MARSSLVILSLLALVMRSLLGLEIRGKEGLKSLLRTDRTVLEQMIWGVSRITINTKTEIFFKNRRYTFSMNL